MVRAAARQSIHLRKGGITMDINTFYSVKITGYNNIFKESVSIYRDAVDFLIPVCIIFARFSIGTGLEYRYPCR